ncbi:MAG: CpaF family protein, partial [Chloroflexi bacterium]|nr:CpaF family protein [Chloroflexota bacterium]
MPVDLLLELEKVRNQGLLFSRYPRIKGSDRVSDRTAGEVPGSQFEQTVGVIRDYLLNQHHDLLRKAVTDRDMRNELKIVIEQVVIERELGFGGYSRALLVERLLHVLAGFGPLEPLLEDPTVDDILVNGVDAVYVERSGRLESTSVKFRSDRDILQVIQRIVSRVGRKINESSPLVDAKLPDGSRVTCAIPPACLNGPILAIRKHRRVTFSSDEYISLGSASPEMMKFLESCVRGKLNIIVSGGTGSGKTTILRVLASYIPPGERLITIEDTGELRLSHPHVLALEATREITVYDLLVNALRMRPDRILLGEVRDREAFTLLEAMSTGHQGSLTTIHANGPTFETLQRLTR